MIEPQPMPEAGAETPAAGRSLRFFCALTGVDPDILQTCPISERFFVIRIGVHLLVTGTFIFACLFFSLWRSLAIDTGSEWFVCFLSSLVALAVCIVDIYIIHASWEEDGRKALETVSRDQRLRFRPRRSRLLNLAPRLLISLVVSVIIAVFLDLYIYRKEIDHQLADNATTKTQAKLYAIHAELEDKLKTKKSSADEAHNQLSAFEAQRTTAALNIASNTAAAIAKIETSSPQLNTQLDKLNQEFDETNAEADQALDYRKKQELQSETKRIGIHRDRVKTQLNLRTIDSDTLNRNRLSPNSSSAEETRLTERYNTSYKEFLAAHANMDKDDDTLLKERGGPVAPAEGFSTRFTALLQYLGGSLSALCLFAFMTTLMMFVEISAVVSKLFFSPKTQYAVRVATQYNSALRQSAFEPDASEKAELEKMKLHAEIEALKAEINARQKEKL